MAVQKHSKLRSQHKAREPLATITVHYHGLSINSVFHAQGAPEERWAEESDSLSRKNFWVQFFSHNKREKFLNPGLKY